MRRTTSDVEKCSGRRNLIASCADGRIIQLQKILLKNIDMYNYTAVSHMQDFFISFFKRFIVYRAGKSGFYGLCRTLLFSDFLPYLSCFPTIFYKILPILFNFHLILRMLKKAYLIPHILPSFYQML